MKKLDAEATLVLTKISKVCDQFNLRPDLPGENANWRRRLGKYHIYLRSIGSNGMLKGNKHLHEVWFAADRKRTVFYKALRRQFSEVRIEGGMADLAVSVSVKL